MSTPNSSVSDALSRTSAATANFLSSFSASLGAGGGLSGLFESLLAGTETLPTTSSANNLTNTNSTLSVTPNSSNASSSSSSSNDLSGMGDIFSALQNFVNKWHSYANQQNNSNNQQQNASSGTSSSAPSSGTSPAAATSGTTTTTTASTGTTTDASTSSSSSSNSTSDPYAPPSFADLLAQLQAILHMLQKQIQTAQATTTGGTQTTATTTSGPTPQDLLAAGSALSDLLALAQSFEKKFGLTPSSDSSSTTDTTAGASGSADPALAVLDTQIRANLKTLLDKLQTATTAAATSQTTEAVPADSSIATNVNLVVPQATAVVTAAIATSDDIIKGALSTADDFLKQLNNLYGNAPTASAVTTAVTADAVASMGSNSGSSLDADQNSGGTNTTTNLNVNGTATTDGANASAESPKSSNPYSFASQLSAARAQNGGTIGLPTAVEQVLLQLNKNAQSGNDQMSLQLHPADLGTINIKLDFGSDGSVSGTVVASNADTLAMLQKDSRSLERALQEAGLRADPGSLQFSLGGQSNGNAQGQSAQNQSSGNGGTTSNTGMNGIAALVSDVEADTTQNWVITPGRVNITV